MNLIRAALLGFATVPSSGCFTARPSEPDLAQQHAARNRTEKPVSHQDKQTFSKFVGRRADEAWEQVCQSSGRKHGDPYGDGFREGFIDYAEAGGTGEPPFLLRYRLTKYRTADGGRTIEDWHAGFRHGAAVARDNGLRELHYGPVIAAGAHTNAAPQFPATTTTAAALVPQPEFLPAPRPAEPGPLPQMSGPVPPVRNQGVAPPSTAPAKPSFIPAALTAGPSTAPPQTFAPTRWSASVAPPGVGAPKVPAVSRPPVVVVESSGPAPLVVPASAVSAPTREPAPKSDFSPWQAVRSARGPTISRDP